MGFVRGWRGRPNTDQNKSEDVSGQSRADVPLNTQIVNNLW